MSTPTIQNNNNTTNMNKPSIKVNQAYLNELDLTWNSLQMEFINQLQQQHQQDSGTKNQLSEQEIEGLKVYLQECKANLLTTFQSQVIVQQQEPAVPVNKNTNNNNIQVKKISNQSFEKIKQFESEVADPNLTEQSVMLTRDLESVVSRVTQLRNEVPRLVQQEVQQTLIKNTITPSPSSSSNETQSTQHPNHQQSLDILNNINENIDSISKDSIKTKEKVSQVLKKSVNVTNATKILN
ncbi:hypothetical protein CYY_001686 [Polysphondylium violaceum]|uniref:Uncharacterized protein n=1 Tax=Polysphondylium violaceum TaxID=133409 RepID=A0A8J4Q2K6_9MYCE|nr:hypothetical protein CYY_001686 [Polysphondylium violaceum]